MRGTILAAAAAVSFVGMAGTANAAIVLTAVPGTDPYSGPAPTYTFETPAPVSGGAIRSGDVSGIAAQPFGSTGNYFTVGPADGTPGFLDLSNFANIAQISFIWGSVDIYNTLDVVDRAGGILATFTGEDASVNPNGNQELPITNPLAFLTISGADQTNIGGLRFSSTQNAFETDNFAITAAVPEPGTWALMLLGFGAIGASLRSRRTRDTMRVRYAF